MYLKNINLINSIRACKNEMNERLYRTMLAKAYVLFYAQKYENRNRIMYAVNRDLEKEGLKYISYMFITSTLKY